MIKIKGNYIFNYLISLDAYQARGKTLIKSGFEKVKPQF